MKVWNTGTELINQLYNNKNIMIQPNQIVELNDDMAVFLLSKRSIRGQGLVQLKLDDDKEERYAQGREQAYNWAKEKWSDYEQHCEEKKSINASPIAPHKELLKYKKTIEEYEAWDKSGRKFSDTSKDMYSNKIYACIICNKEFSNKDLYIEHVKNCKAKEETSVHPVRIDIKGSGKN